MLSFKPNKDWTVHTKTVVQWWLLGLVWIGWCLYHGHYLESTLHGGTITAVTMAHEKIYRQADPSRYPLSLYVTFLALWLLGPGSVLLGILIPRSFFQ